MARLTLEKVRNNVDAIELGKAGLANDQKLKRKMINRAYKRTGNEAFASALAHEGKLETRHKKAKQCALNRQIQPVRPDHPTRRDYRSPEGFNRCQANVGRSYVNRAAERKEAKQADFPDVMRHPATVDLAIVPLTASLKTEVDVIRPRLRAALSDLSFGHQVEGSFQVSLHSAEHLAGIFPEDEWPEGFDSIGRPDEVFALLHGHWVICDPDLSKSNVRKLLTAAFPGCHRVCVRKVIPERVDQYGRTTHGAQGFLEYGLMNKTEIKFSKTKQKIEAVLGHALLASTWSKRNRNFSMGQPLAKSGVEINTDRVIELELMERLHHLRKTWRKLGHGERFLHLWFSGMIKLVKRPRAWLKLKGNIPDQIKQFIHLVSNWCDDSTAEGTDFIDYMVASLEQFVFNAVVLGNRYEFHATSG